MDNKEKDNKKEYPGYPHYPAKEDITKPDNNTGKITISPKDNDLDNEPDETPDIVMGTDADVTEEDLDNLGDKDQDMDMGEDEDISNTQGLDETDDDGEPLNENSGHGLSSTGHDLDVPGSKLDDADENIGEEDEENNYYSRSQNDGENTEGIP